MSLKSNGNQFAKMLRRRREGTQASCLLFIGPHLGANGFGMTGVGDRVFDTQMSEGLCESCASTAESGKTVLISTPVLVKVNGSERASGPMCTHGSQSNASDT